MFFVSPKPVVPIISSSRSSRPAAANLLQNHVRHPRGLVRRRRSVGWMLSSPRQSLRVRRCGLARTRLPEGWVQIAPRPSPMLDGAVSRRRATKRSGCRTRCDRPMLGTARRRANPPPRGAGTERRVEWRRLDPPRRGRGHKVIPCMVQHDVVRTFSPGMVTRDRQGASLPQVGRSCVSQTAPTTQGFGSARPRAVPCELRMWRVRHFHATTRVRADPKPCGVGAVTGASISREG